MSIDNFNKDKENRLDQSVFSSPSDRKSSFENDINAIIFPMSNLQVNNNFNNSKRSNEQRTIEGSPFHPSFKNLDNSTIDDFDNQLFKRLDNSTTPATLKKVEPIDSTTNNSSKTSKVIVITSGGEHDTGIHQENALRTSLLVSDENGCLKRENLNDFIHWEINEKIRYPSLVDLLRVHEYSYLQYLERKVDSTELLPPFYAALGQLDSDTPLGTHSLDAAKRYCGAAMNAVDIAMDKHGNNINKENDLNRIFVIGRPPGHHAGPNGCVVSNYYWKRPDMSSSGFCLLNTVAVAAAYARCQYGSNSSNSSNPPKIAIIDFDIHHGNGTEEIVRNLKPHDIFLPLPSSWAPRSQLSYKPWLNENDSDDVLFASINLHEGDRFYPCSGNDSIDENIINISLTPIGPGPWDQKQRSKLTLSAKHELIKIASEEFRSKISTILLPKLASFQADITFLSSGFDGHIDDFYHFLTELDYHWITQAICQINPNIPIISILEGGYSLTSPYNVKNNKFHDKNNSSSFCQRPGDGGLVKGVLAHVAALANKETWLN